MEKRIVFVNYDDVILYHQFVEECIRFSNGGIVSVCDMFTISKGDYEIRKKWNKERICLWKEIHKDQVTRQIVVDVDLFLQSYQSILLVIVDSIDEVNGLQAHLDRIIGPVACYSRVYIGDMATVRDQKFNNFCLTSRTRRLPDQVEKLLGNSKMYQRNRTLIR